MLKTAWDIYRNFIHSHQNPEITKISFNKWIDEQTILHPCNGVAFSNKIKLSRLPVSSSVSRELGSSHCVLKASRKLSKLKKSTVFGSKRARAQDKPLPHNYPEQRLRSRNCHRIQDWSRNIWTVVDEFLEAQCEKPWELKTAGGPSHRAPHPTILWDLSPETQPSSHNKY